MRPIDFIERLRGIVGRTNVLTASEAQRFEMGYRYGAGSAEAFIRPGSHFEQLRVPAEYIHRGPSLYGQIGVKVSLTGS